jgi:hypothetical protein
MLILPSKIKFDFTLDGFLKFVKLVMQEGTVQSLSPVAET